MKHKLSTRVLSMLMAIIMMLSLTTSVFAADPPASAEPEVIVEEAAQNSPAPSASPAPGDDPSRLSTVYEGHRIHYIDSKKQPLPKNAELFMNEINEDDVPFYLQRAAHSLGLESCDMYLYFIADPLIEDASTAEILKYQANPDDPEDRMTVEVTLIDDSKMTDEEKELRLEELQNIHLEDLRVIQLGAYWDYDTILPHSEENGVIRFEIEKIAPFILFIPDWESAVYIPEEPEPAEVPEEIAAPTEDTGTQQVTEPADQPAELTPVPEETVDTVETVEPVSEVPSEVPEAPTPDDNIQNPEPASDEEPVEEVNEQTVTASGTDYSVSLTYTADANIPEGSMFELSELPASGILYDTLTTSVASTLNAETEEISSVTFVDVDVKKDGDSVPLDAPVSVSIAVDDPADGDTVTQVVALGQQNEVLNPEEGNDGTFSSTTENLDSTYAIVRITKQATLKTSDDHTWLITVTYSRDDSAIPADVELVVNELKEGDPGYDEYIAASAAAAGADRENIAFAKAFDICLIDPATGLECQPTKDVSVSIQLLEEEVRDSAPVDVIHFGEEESPKQLDAALNAENAIEFATPGFSVFVIMQVIKEQILTASDGQSYKVTVTYDNDSGIPEDAELVVSELKEGDLGYDEYIAQSAALTGADPEVLAFAKAFDISFIDKETGEEVQPTSDVSVSIQLLEEAVNENTQIDVVHFGQEVEQLDAAVNGDAIEFGAGGFSVYVVLGYTVDFHWGEYTYSIAGESEILLSALLEKLGVTEIALSDVADVRFSDPTLVEVKKIEATEAQTEDWLLTSLAPFDTEEALTLTLKNGRSVEIRVTDEESEYGTLIDSATANHVTWAEYQNGTEYTLVVTVEEGYTGVVPAIQNTTHANGTKLANEVTKVILGEGITGFAGNDTFNGYKKLRECVPCSTLTSIPQSTFRKSSLQVFDFSKATGLVSLGKQAFSPSNLTSIDLSGLENLTTINDSVWNQQYNSDSAYSSTPKATKLDFSGCINLQTIGNTVFNGIASSIIELDISQTRLTTLTKFETLTKLATLTARNCTSLTTPDVQKFTKLTTLDFTDSSNITGISNVNLCTALKNLYLAGTGISTLNLNSNSALETLELPSTLTSLNASSCTKLSSIYFDGSDTEWAALVAKGTISLPAGFNTNNITFKTLEPSTTLNEFIDGNTQYRIDDGEAKALSVPVLLGADRAVTMLLHFSEIPEGQTDERQMNVSSGQTLTYELPDGVTINETDYSRAVSINGTQIGTVTEHNGILNLVCDEIADAITENTELAFVIEVPVTLAAGLNSVDFGNGAVLTVSSNHNPYVDSKTAGAYDPDTNTITYTVVVKADGDVDNGEKEYPVKISDEMGIALSFHTGTFSYTHAGTVPNGKPNPVISWDGGSVENPDTTAEFSGFPVTVEHMYDGDTITFSYTAAVDLDKIEQFGTITDAELGNKLTLDNTGNPGNVSSDDESEIVKPSAFSFSDISIEGTPAGSGIDANSIPYQDVVWTIRSNAQGKTGLRGTIRSTQSAPVSVQLVGKGISVKATDPTSGELKYEKQITWGADALSVSGSDWEWTIPEALAGCLYTLEVSFTARYALSGGQDSVEVSSSVTGHTGLATGTATVTKTAFMSKSHVRGAAENTYTFTIDIGGVTAASLTNNALVVVDTLDTQYASLWKLESGTVQAVAADKNKQGVTIGAVDQNGVITFTLTDLPSESEIYRITYGVTPRDDNALKALKGLAVVANEGETVGERHFTNEAVITSGTGGMSASSEYAFLYSPISHSFDSVSGSWASYTVDINPDALALNGNSPMPLTLALGNNQVLETSSIHITENTGTCTYNADSGSFSIPDGTHVTIEYMTRLLGVPESTISFSNTATLHAANDYSDTADGTATLPGENPQPESDPVYTFTFYDLNADGDYTVQPVWNEQGTRLTSQSVRSVDELIIPQPASSEAFMGWYEEITGDTGTAHLAEKAFNFDNLLDREKPDEYEINLRAVYAEEYAYVYFHGQKTSDSESSPVAYIRKAMMEEEIGDNGIATGRKIAWIKISDLDVPYSSDGTETMAFRGWSETEVEPGVYWNDSESKSYIISWTENDSHKGKIAVVAQVNQQYPIILDLYPIFRTVRRLSYYSGPAGSGATYVPTVAYCEDEGPSVLEVPVWEGHTFLGWYTENETAQISYANGSLITNAYDETHGVRVLQGPRLNLFKGDATLYAKWSDETTVPWKIIVWKQNPTDKQTYAFVKSIEMTAVPNETVFVPESMQTSEKPNGFKFSRCDEQVKVNEDGYTILNIYFDLDDYSLSDETHTLLFLDSTKEDQQSDVYPKIQETINVSRDTPLEGLLPAEPESRIKGNSGANGQDGPEVFTFSGWYADPICSTRVFFDEESYNSYEYSKVLYKTMPDEDLSLYAGWSANWYLVQIDPNYGDFHGSGGTWFWETFDGDLVREYTQVTRDYEQSSSGTWFYRKYDRAHYGYSGNEWDKSEEDRQAFYTNDPGQATEDTTFEPAPGMYAYAGWYEVHEDGTETPYDFSLHVDHDMLLRLHWQKAGEFYIAYDAGSGKLENGLKEELVGQAYSDNAVIILNRSAVASQNSNETFVGWKIRGDGGETVYRVGETFTLHADDAIRVSGKEIVYLDAVYKNAGMASVVYDANGGVLDGTYTGTGTVDTEAGTITETGYAINATVELLSRGFRYEATGVHLAGWRDESGNLYPLGGTYLTASATPMRFYAVWETTITYHLNNSSATWGTEWDDSSKYYRENDTYKQIAYLGDKIAAPVISPYQDSDGKLFRCWTADNNGTTEYDFSQPITGALDLYAYWEALEIYAVDASTAVLTPLDWNNIVIPTDGTVTELIGNSFGIPDGVNGYTLAFAAVAADMDSIAEDRAITEIKYDSATNRLCVKFKNTSDFTSLARGQKLYFVYYQEKQLDISYRAMESTGGLGGEVAPAGVTEPILDSDYSMTSIENPRSLGGDTYAYYAFAVGTSEASNASHMYVMTATSTSDETRPELMVRNTWRGFQYSTDGTTWYDCGYEITLYVLYFEMQPTMIRFEEKTFGTAENIDTKFEYNLVVTEQTTKTTTVEQWDDNTQQTIETTTRVYWDDSTQRWSDQPQTTTRYDSNNIDGNGTRNPYILSNGEAHSAILFYQKTEDVNENGNEKTTVTTVTEQTAQLTQTAELEQLDPNDPALTPKANEDFTTTLSAKEGVLDQPSKCWTYTSVGANETKTVTFTNTLKPYPVTVHVAIVEADETADGFFRRDNLRTDVEADYCFDLELDKSVDLLDKLPALACTRVEKDANGDPITVSYNGLFTGDTYTYAFGMILCAQQGAGEGGAINTVYSGVSTIGYDKTGENTWLLVLKDSDGHVLGNLEDRDLYYLYYPMPKIRYVTKTSVGVVTEDDLIKGCLPNPVTQVIEESNSITYNHAPLTVNGLPVEQDESFEIAMSGFVISQSGKGFRMPSILDSGTRERYLKYVKIGVGDANGITAIDDGCVLHLKVEDNTLKYSFDGVDWAPLALSATPTIYAIYDERGYDLMICKNVDTNQSGKDPIFTEKTFTVTISSPEGIKNGREYKLEGADTVIKTAQNNSLVLTVKDGSKIKIKELGWGNYSITESRGENYVLTASVGPIVGNAAAPVSLDSSGNVPIALSTETKVTLTNTPKPICRIGNQTFYTLRSAMAYVQAQPSHSATIEMLTDYWMPAADTVEIPEDYTITLKTADSNFTGAGSSAVISRDLDLTEKPLFENEGSLTFNTIVLDGNSVIASKPLIQSSGALSITNAQIQNAISTENGGAINATAGSIEIQNSNISGNKAANGGAIYAKGVTITLFRNSDSLSVSLSSNEATSGNGGAIYLDNGIINLTGDFGLSNNKATSGNGGAIYASSVELNIDQNGSLTGNEAKSGGAIFAPRAQISISDASIISGNKATSGNGGALWLGAGRVEISGGSFTGNTASGNGGAVYTDVGFSLSNTTKETTVDGVTQTVVTTPQFTGNEAANGAAIFVNSGSGVISGGNITRNVATSGTGGAVGVGGTAVKLQFSDAATITGNTDKATGGARNVCLDQNTDAVINTSGLSDPTANVGIYVPNLYDEYGVEYQYKNHGDVGGLFGTYSGSNTDVSGFHNDRQPDLSATMDSSAGKIFWSNAITVEVYYKGHFRDGLLPSGDKKAGPLTYYPTHSSAALSVIADDLRGTVSNLSSTAVYATALLGSDYYEYLTRLDWEYDQTKDKWEWKITKRDGTKSALGGATIKVYFAQPTFLSIENNSPYDLDVTSLTIQFKNASGWTKSLINTTTEAGWGLVFARDGVIQSELLPVQGPLVLAKNGGSISILIPGGQRSSQYPRFVLNGSLKDYNVTPTPVKLRMNGSDVDDITTQVFTKEDGTPTDSSTYEIVLGGAKEICRIQQTGVKYTTLNAAVTAAAEAGLENVTIEMLVDYLMPGSDVVKITNDSAYPLTDSNNVSNGFVYLANLKSITFTTSQEYKDQSGKSHGTISRGNGNTSDPLITVQGKLDNGAIGTTVDLTDLSFDGKSLTGASNGGALRTNNCKVTIKSSSKNDPVELKNFISNNGGAVYISFGTEIIVSNNDPKKVQYKYSYEANFNADNAVLKIENADFTGNQAQSSANRAGGGAIWTNARLLDMDNCGVSLCSGIDQGGGVFHRIDTKTNNNSYPECTFATQTETQIDNCRFYNCESRSGGGMESDAHKVMVNGCTFTNCKSKPTTRGDGSGGAISTYIFEKSSFVSYGSEYDTSLKVKDTIIRNCTSERKNTSSLNGGHGGAIRSHSLKTTLENCTIDNCSAHITGGAVSMYNSNASELIILGGSISGCTAGSHGGAIYCLAPILKINVDDEGNLVQNETAIKSCTSGGSGGAIWHGRNNKNDDAAQIVSCTLDQCTAALSGGAYFSDSVRAVSFTDSEIKNCEATGGNGGGISCAAGPLMLIDVSVDGNKAGGIGGGVYCLQNLTLQNTVVKENQLSTTTVENAAGVYLSNGKTLSIGDAAKAADNNYKDTTAIYGNTTSDLKPSNLRLPEVSSGENDNKVVVNCNLEVTGKIYVINAKNAGTQFGTSPNSEASGWRPTGLSDMDSVFRADNSTLYGIIDRGDTTGQRIIWAGKPICKLTDSLGNDLYFGESGSDPAIFDKLDDTNPNGSRTSPFNLFRGTELPILRYKDGSGYSGTVFCIKMLVENYETETPLNAAFGQNVTVTLTTAGTADKSDVTNPDNDYPYVGYSTRATVKLAPSAGNYPLLSTGGSSAMKLVLESIILDGNKGVTTASDNTRILNVNNSNADAMVTLGDNATLENAVVTGNGGGVSVTDGKFVISGGTIRNCTSANGGGVCVSGGSFSFSDGNIYGCEASDDNGGNGGNGGGVCVVGGSFSMSGGTIGSRIALNARQNKAINGGGVYVTAGNEMHMSGGYISNNNVTGKGGGIAVEYVHVDENVDVDENEIPKLYFSGRVNVSGNTSSRDDIASRDGICNVELEINLNKIIRTEDSGLSRGAYVGVYVPGNDTENQPDSMTQYDKHGDLLKPFGTFEDADEIATLYCFVNDRNGLKGGRPKDAVPNTIYWIQIFALDVHKEVVPGSSGIVDLNEEFHFMVILSGRDNNNVPASNISSYNPDGTINDFYGEMIFAPNTNNETSVAEFVLKHEDHITAINLLEGIQYQVVEKLTPEQAKKYAAIPATRDASVEVDQDGTQWVCYRYPTNSEGLYIGENKGSTLVDPYTSEVEFSNIMPVCKITDAEGALLYRKVTVITGKDQNVQTDYLVPAVYTELTGDDGAFKALSDTLASGKPYYYRADGTQYTLGGANGQVQIQMLIPTYTMTAAVVAPPLPITLTTAAANAEVFPFQGQNTEFPATILRGGSFSNESMFTVVNGGAITLTDITLNGNKTAYSADVDGGVVYVQTGGTLSIQTGARLQNSWVKASAADTTRHGGAVYVKSGGMLEMKNRTNRNGTVEESGGAITGNISDGDGAGVYLEQGSTMKISGKPAFGGTGTNNSGTILSDNRKNMKSGRLNQKTNGGMIYDFAHQDIYIAGYESSSDDDDSAASLVVNGNITSGAGTIWVWAEQSPRYKTLCQFAKYTADVTDTETTLAAFRNAQDDVTTGADQVGQYLYGITKADDTGYNVFWYGIEGSRKVILRKVDGAFNPVEATFQIHRGSAEGSLVYVEDASGNRIDTFTSGSSGAFFIGELSYGTYYIVETSLNNKTFTVTVNDDGVGYYVGGAYSNEVRR